MKKHWPYRFKTEKEFIEEFGENWNNNINWANQSMNYLFGIPFEYDCETDIKNNHYIGHFVFGHTSWSIDTIMLTKNTLPVPNYNPKKFVY